MRIPIFNTFWEAVNTEQWNSSMPTNALLISGPSKTADIEKPWFTEFTAAKSWLCF
jgi:L-lactate dehydrogenase complex protein LldG